MTSPNESATTNGAPVCPKCGGTMWDNGSSKGSPNAPDFKCRDKGCNGAIWPSRGAVCAPVRATPAPSIVAPPVGAPAHATGVTAADFVALAALHRRCVAFVSKEEGPLLEGAAGDVAGAVAALAGSLFAELRRGGRS